MPTILDHLITKLSLDGVGFQRGLQQAGVQADAFGKKIGVGLKSQIAGAFAIGSVTAFARSVSQTVGNIKDMADRLNLSTDAVQRLELAGKTSGVQMGNIETAITKLFDGIQDGSKDAIAGLSKLGLSASDVAGKSFNETFTTISERLLAVSDSALQANIAMDLFGSKGGLKVLQVLREMQSAEQWPLFSDDQIQKIDEAGDAMVFAMRQAELAAATAYTEIARVMEAFAIMAATGKSPREVGVEMARQDAERAEINRRGRPGRMSVGGEGDTSAAEGWMKFQDELLRIQTQTERNFADVAEAGMTIEARRVALLEKRLVLERELDSFSMDRKGDAIRQANALLGISAIDKELVGLKPDVKATARAISVTPANELAQIGGRASVAGTGQASVVSELRKLNDALTRRGVKLARF